MTTPWRAGRPSQTTRQPHSRSTAWATRLPSNSSGRTDRRTGPAARASHVGAGIEAAKSRAPASQHSAPVDGTVADVGAMLRAIEMDAAQRLVRALLGSARGVAQSGHA